MNYYMPTKIYIGELKKGEFMGFGNKALIVTGKSSKKNGSLNDVVDILKENGTKYVIYDETKENPSLEEIQNVGEIGLNENVNFIIGLGGGSSLDASKAISCYIKSKLKDNRDLLTRNDLDFLPVLAIPTTCGTGSETTPYSILTDHVTKTKAGMATPVFPEKAFLNYKYLKTLPNVLVKSTTLDALCHLIEGYLTNQTNEIMDTIAIGSFKTFANIKNNLIEEEYTDEFLKTTLVFSTIAGINISIAKTSLPHGLGYNLTYFKNVYHGFACCLFMYEYLKFHKDKDRVNCILNSLEIDTLEDFKSYLDQLITVDINLSKEDVEKYINKTFDNKSKLSLHPYPISRKDIEMIYYNSLNAYISS